MEPLLSLQITAQTDKIFRDILHWASKFGHIKLVERLLEILIEVDVVVVATTQFNKALGLAAKNSHLNVINCSLDIRAIVIGVSVSDYYALLEAAKNGHLDVVHCLLKVDGFRARVAVNNNHALREAASNGHLNVVNLLLEYAFVRRAPLIVNSGQNFITQGLKRALWLNLQEVPGFSGIRTPIGLSALAHRYLQTHPDWIHTSYTQEMQDALLRSSSNQALAFADSTPLYTVHKCAPDSVITKTTSPLLPLRGH